MIRDDFPMNHFREVNQLFGPVRVCCNGSRPASRADDHVTSARDLTEAQLAIELDLGATGVLAVLVKV